MANLVEGDIWEPGIYQLEESDPVLGGADGIDNLQAKQLGARTKYLKAQQEAHAAAADPHPQYMTTAESEAAIAAAVAALVNSSPAALDTLAELATALGNDPNYATTITNALAGKQPLDATLTALAAIATATDKLIYATDADTFATTTLSAFIRTLLDDADAATALATLGAAAASNVRIRLTANTTFYVSTAGSDSNNGLSAGSPFLTIQKAINTIHENYDLNGYTATIQLADGTYTAGGFVFGPFIGTKLIGSVVIQGNSGSPANVLLNITSDNGFYSTGGGRFTVKDMKIQTTTSGHGIAADTGSVIYFGNIIFGACAGYQLVATYGAIIQAISNYSISGGSNVHLLADRGGHIAVSGVTVTLSGTPNFAASFAQSYELGRIYCPNLTFSGSATGTRYVVGLNAAINTNGGGANYFPGNAAGSTATGGQYA